MRWEAVMSLLNFLLGRKREPCMVSVWYVNVPGQGGPPYYVARCDCGWVGMPDEDTEESARLEASRHSDQVRPDVEEIT